LSGTHPFNLLGEGEERAEGREGVRKVVNSQGKEKGEGREGEIEHGFS